LENENGTILGVGLLNARIVEIIGRKEATNTQHHRNTST